MGKVHSRLNGSSIILDVQLPRGRQLAVVIKPHAARSEEEGAKLTFEIWGRFVGERLWHAWGSPHLGDDFLESLESAIVVGGLEELMEACIRRQLDTETMSLAAGAVHIVLEAAAAPGAPPAAPLV